MEYLGKIIFAICFTLFHEPRFLIMKGISGNEPGKPNVILLVFRNTGTSETKDGRVIRYWVRRLIGKRDNKSFRICMSRKQDVHLIGNFRLTKEREALPLFLD